METDTLSNEDEFIDELAISITAIARDLSEQSNDGK